MLFDPHKWKMPEESYEVEILKAARRRVIQGWSHGCGRDDKGGRCAQQAVFEVAGWIHNDILLGRTDKTFSYLYRAIGGYFSIPEWNDKPERTLADVVAAFDRAIKYAREDAAVMANKG